MKDRTLWIGIDVGSKNFLAAIDFPVIFNGQEKQDVTNLESKDFKMTPAGVKSFLRWVAFKQDEFLSEYASEEQEELPAKFLMESTGICSAELEKMICSVSPEAEIIIANPEPIKAFQTSLNLKNKTDKIDSQVIARYGRERSPEPKLKLSPELQQLRAYSRARSFLKDQRTAINNYHDNVEETLPKKMCTNVVKQIDKEIAELNREINKTINNNTEINHEISVMTTMPGVGVASAVAIICELGSLKNFKTREKMVAMSGLNPVKKQSGTSVNQTRISKKGSPVVRRFLYMDSKTALPRIPALQELYDRLLTKGNTRMQARCAVMRKMLLMLRGMVKNDLPYSDGPAKSRAGSFCASRKSRTGAFSVVTLRVSALKLPVRSFSRSIKKLTIGTFGRAVYSEDKGKNLEKNENMA